MKKPLTSVILRRVREGRAAVEQDQVAREAFLTIFLNGVEIATLSCTPTAWDYLAVGFLFAEGLLESADDLLTVEVDPEKGFVQVESTRSERLETLQTLAPVLSSGCGRGVTFRHHRGFLGLPRVESKFTLASGQIRALVKGLEQQAELFRQTGAVHSAALGSPAGLLLVHEDLGRHNAVDKVLGECLLRRISTEDKVLLSSGRLTSEIVLKAVRHRVPILVSRCAVTDVAIQYARSLGLTLIGFVRGRRMNIYTGAKRIKP